MTGLILVIGAWAFADIALRILGWLDARNERHTRAVQDSVRREWVRREHDAS
jgi:hypothetical protein